MRQRHFVAAISVLTFAVAAYGAWTLAQPQNDPQGGSMADLDRIYSPPEILTVSEGDGTLSISGTSEPSAIVTLSVNGERERSVPADVEGAWSSDLVVSPESVSEVSVEAFLDELGMRGDQTVLRVPAPGVEDGIAQRPLILLTSPGGPSRVIQTPFGSPLADGPLALVILEYDAKGGTVFAGRGEPGSVIVLESDRGRLGGFPVGPDGRWFSVIVEPETNGDRTYTLRDAAGRELAIAFQPLAGGAADIAFAPDHWQVRRRLEGGGSQVAVVFATPVVDTADIEG